MSVNDALAQRQADTGALRFREPASGVRDAHRENLLKGTRADANHSPVDQRTQAVLDRVLDQRDQHHRREGAALERLRDVDRKLESRPAAHAVDVEEQERRRERKLARDVLRELNVGLRLLQLVLAARDQKKVVAVARNQIPGALVSLEFQIVPFVNFRRDSLAVAGNIMSVNVDDHEQ